MTWFKVDDQFLTHRKALAVGPAGRHLWFTVGTLCAASNVGVAEPPTLQMAAFMTGVDIDATARLLVTAGLWHDDKALRRCAPCKDRIGKIPAGAYYFHDWHEHQLSAKEAKEAVERFRWSRAKRLKRDFRLLDEVRRRDAGRCRYCDRLVDFDNPDQGDGATYDHVDPEGDNTAANVVLACRRCNGNKKNRTPADAAMPLLPHRGPGADMSADTPRTVPASRVPRTRDGTGPRTVRGHSGSSRGGPGGAGDGPGDGVGADRPAHTSNEGATQ